VGTGTTQNQMSPIRIETLSNIIQVSAWNMSAALNESGEVFIWGCAGCLKPTKQAFDQQFSEIKVGGSFIVLADDNGHLLQTDGIQKPKYIEGVNEKISL
jgi:hypothetical protein